MRATPLVRGLSLGIVMLVVAYAALYGFSVNILYTRDARYEAEEWMEGHMARDASVLGIEPGYSLPRFRAEQNVELRRIWDYNGNQLTDIHDVDADYVVLSLSIPRRREHRREVEQFFAERGYHAVAVFKSKVPFFVPEVADLHAVRPEVVILKRVVGPSTSSRSAS
jgi:hypothetical protein